jgi:EipB-like
MLRPLLGLLAGLLVLAPPVGAAASVELLSHRAAYRLSLVSADRDSGIAGVRGGLVVEWRASCDGWLSHQRLGFVAATEEGPGFTYDVRFSSWESRDDTKLRFTMRAYDDGELGEEFRGEAALDGPGRGGEVRFTVPDKDPMALPAGTIFPTQHVRQILEAARAGEQFVAHEVFDGSGEDGLSRVTAVIGEPREIEGERRWRVNLAYYDLAGANGGDVLPAFELAFDVNEGGVLHEVRLDYGEFALQGELEQLERLPVESCE